MVLARPARHFAGQECDRLLFGCWRGRAIRGGCDLAQEENRHADREHCALSGETIQIG